MATFPSIVPSFGSAPRTDMRVLEAQFGDGYTQRSGDGINSTRITWDLIWENIDDTDASTIETFLKARGGHEAFDWTPPNGTASKWTCTGFNGPTPTGYNSNTIRATFREEFDL